MGDLFRFADRLQQIKGDESLEPRRKTCSPVTTRREELAFVI